MLLWSRIFWRLLRKNVYSNRVLSWSYYKWFDIEDFFYLFLNDKEYNGTINTTHMFYLYSKYFSDFKGATFYWILYKYDILFYYFKHLGHIWDFQIIIKIHKSLMWYQNKEIFDLLYDGIMGNYKNLTIKRSLYS